MSCIARTYHSWFFVTGIYGHTAVYYTTRGIIFVFGGYRFRVHKVRASGELYSLDHATGHWNILQALPSNEVSSANQDRPARFTREDRAFRNARKRLFCSLDHIDLQLLQQAEVRDDLLSLSRSFFSSNTIFFQKQCATSQNLFSRAFVVKKYVENILTRTNC